MVTINAEHAFSVVVDKILLPTTKVLLRAAVVNISKLNHHRDWAVLNAVLVPPSLAKVVVLEGETE